MADAFFAPDSTRPGELPPWEVAKAVAYKTVLADISQHLGTPASELVGGPVPEYIASKLTAQGGGTITARALQKVLARCSDADWYPGKGSARQGAGRPDTYSEHQKQEVARVGMDLKRKLIRPTPRNVKARLSKASRNPETDAPMSRSTVNRIFKTSNEHVSWCSRLFETEMMRKCLSVCRCALWVVCPGGACSVYPMILKPHVAACAKNLLATWNKTAKKSVCKTVFCHVPNCDRH